MSGTYLLRTDGDNVVGQGHLTRCIALATEFKKFSLRPILAMRIADAGARTVIARNRIETHYLASRHGLKSEIDELKRLRLPDLRGVILDIAHPKTFSQLNLVPSYLRSLRTIAPVLAIIDGYDRTSLAGNIGNLDVDILITPYYGVKDDQQKSPGSMSRLTGPSYFVCAPDYDQYLGKQHRISDEPDRILVTFGGADPQRITLKALVALELLRERNLEIRVAVGSSFEPQLSDAICMAANAGFHRYEILRAPPSLAAHMDWSDLAISSSGLTKYELALTGTPSIQISIDESHARVNELFIKAGSGIHLGAHTAVTAEHLADEVRQMLGNAGIRGEMSRLGQQLTDGYGANRIVNELQRVSHANTRI